MDSGIVLQQLGTITYSVETIDGALSKGMLTG